MESCKLNHGLSSDHFISVTAHLGGISVIHYPEVSALLGPWDALSPDHLTPGHPVLGCGVGGTLGAPDGVLHVLGGALGGDLGPCRVKELLNINALIRDIHLS